MRPGRLVEQLARYRFPDELRGRYRDLDVEARRAILGGNAARLYGLGGERLAPSVAAQRG